MTDNLIVQISIIDAASRHPWMAGIAVLAISMVVTAIAIPKVLSLSARRGFYDLPAPRKVHTNPVSRLGGMAFVPVIVLAVALAAALIIAVKDGETGFEMHGLQLTLGLAALMVMYVVGLVDDISGVRYRTKLLLQAVSASMIAFSGLAIDNLHGIFGIQQLPPLATFALTVVVVMLIINAINFMDGIDGLGGGLAIAALCAYASLAMKGSDVASLAISAATIGALIPFLWHNVMGKREKGNKIFMGDTGALSLGLILSYLALSANASATGADMSAVQTLAFAPLALPCLDLLRVVVSRALHRKNPFLPDRTHFHHKLIALGWGQKSAAAFTVGLSALFTVMAANMAGEVGSLTILLCLSAIWCAVNITVNIFHSRKTNKTTI